MLDNITRVLLIEDNESDLFLAKRQIKKAVPKSVFTTIAKKEQLEEKAEWLLPDLVVSDYHLAIDFTGLDAMLFLRERYPDVPFIIVSGAINDDEKVAELIYKGADSFLKKDNFNQLPETILEVMAKSTEKRARQNEYFARQSEKKILVQKMTEQLSNAPDFPQKDDLLAACFKLNNLITDSKD